MQWEEKIQPGRNGEESHCFPDKSTSPVPNVKLSVLSLHFPCFSSGSQGQHPVLDGFNYPLTGVILGTCCYTCALTLLPVITLKTKGLCMCQSCHLLQLCFSQDRENSSTMHDMQYASDTAVAVIKLVITNTVPTSERVY